MLRNALLSFDGYTRKERDFSALPLRIRADEFYSTLSGVVSGFSRVRLLRFGKCAAQSRRADSDVCRKMVTTHGNEDIEHSPYSERVIALVVIKPSTGEARKPSTCTQSHLKPATILFRSKLWGIGEPSQPWFEAKLFAPGESDPCTVATSVGIAKG